MSQSVHLSVSPSSETTRNTLESCLRQLKCHFTWNLVEGGKSLDDFEDEVCNTTEFQNNEFKATVFNILAYIKHRRGHDEAALECLQRAEELIQREHAEQADIRSLVTWGNYAWVCYHMSRLPETPSYVDKVGNGFAVHAKQCLSTSADWMPLQGKKQTNTEVKEVYQELDKRSCGGGEASCVTLRKLSS